jgi:GNAT superfamily N-acetyltransferase
MIRPAGRADTPPLVTTLAAAFAPDPAFAWLMPGDAGREARLRHFFPALVRSAIAGGLVLTAPDHAAVTVWRLPGRLRPGRLEMLRALPALARAFGGGARRAGVLARSLEQHAPQGRAYWYLQFAGVRPDRQGQGLGGAAIRAGLERTDAAGLPAYLEAAKPGNVAIYEGLGFRVVDEWDVPGGGPRFWGMLREPAAG